MILSKDFGVSGGPSFVIWIKIKPNERIIMKRFIISIIKKLHIYLKYAKASGGECR